ncbi:RimK/LysX family protein [Photobacterium damselae]|uniref:putative ATP-dependent zinc protease n=1 Tax=Photobacterium damselae TaxID=38293 RepID=UPI004067E122
MTSTVLKGLGLITLIYANKLHNKKIIVGPIEKIWVSDINMYYNARIDTGAETTSIHAFDIKVLTEKEIKMRNNIGKLIEFKTMNENGKIARHKGTIVNVNKIRNAQGVERRYAIAMTLKFNGRSRTILVNLRNRHKLKYKLLIGRNWLNDSYLVDVSKKQNQ